MNIIQKLSLLKNAMKEKNIDYYIVPSCDFHDSEYVGDYFKAREYITSFNGSSGTALITKDNAYLWTDGRYFLQAAMQLENTGIQLMKMGEKGVPTILDFIEKSIKDNENIGFDGRVISVNDGMNYKKIVEKKNGNIIYEHDLIDEIWTDRPTMSKEKVFALDISYSGESTTSKLEKIRKTMKEHNSTHHIITTLDDICWILNIRGNDISYCPLVLSYLIITLDKVYLYIDESKISQEIQDTLSRDNIVIKPYNNIYEDVKNISQNDTVMLEMSKINYALYNNISKDTKIVDTLTPSTLLKSIKNKTEIENQKKAQLMDAVAHIKFMKWLKESIGKIEITEISASEKLDEFRKLNSSYIQPSFSPISAFGSNGAIIHYSADEESNATLQSDNLYMTDTGATYYEGTTDITRTYALGKVSDTMKEHFTIVAMSNLSMASAKFLYGTSGANLDILARQPFWDRNLNYNHGTGHGVGYMLNVHEGPMSLRWQKSKESLQNFEEGMIITDEPGIYIQGSHGIRLENELLVVKDVENEYGTFMKFEVMSYIPFDLDAIDVSIMSDTDKKRLNDYHKKVYEKLANHLNEDEKKWLKHYTRSV